MAIDLPIDIATVKGFLAAEEGETLYKYALQASKLGPCLEIGSYCGKATVYFGSACKKTGAVLYSIDHHRGSEEQQPGEEYFDPDLFDTNDKLFDSFPEFRRTLNRAQLNETVIPIVTTSQVASRTWVTPLAMIFIDGGHSIDAALGDYRSWVGHIVPEGILAIHDIFCDPADGGQAPYQIWTLALKSGLFKQIALVNSLGILQRIT